MASCEKCWVDSRRRGVSYSTLLHERDADGETCTPEQQAGPDATKCPECGKQTVHQYAKVCMACGTDFYVEISDGTR